MNEESSTESKPQTQFDIIEKRFVEREHDLFKLRAFIDKHRTVLEQLGQCWEAFGYDGKIKFNDNYQGKQEPKLIARLFGADGWTRKPNSYSCGRIDWFKELDGVSLMIANAEQIKPLITEVKL
jgi:hypothetical protein